MPCYCNAIFIAPHAAFVAHLLDSASPSVACLKCQFAHNASRLRSVPREDTPLAATRNQSFLMGSNFFPAEIRLLSSGRRMWSALRHSPARNKFYKLEVQSPSLHQSFDQPDFYFVVPQKCRSKVPKSPKIDFNIPFSHMSLDHRGTLLLHSHQSW
jgi:hypothetical protein